MGNMEAYADMTQEQKDRYGFSAKDEFVLCGDEVIATACTSELATKIAYLLSEADKSDDD